ncbi:MAG TPA: hypothetical protein VHC22_33145 [Pirellulales bacterium]|nr:hypothetical protein [Pirellulales bacterium]
MHASFLPPRPTLIGLLLAVGLAALSVALDRSSWLVADENADGSATGVTQKVPLRREGTQLRDEQGRFQPVGDRLTFLSSAGVSYIGLENLNLERVGKIVSASPEAVDWYITGTVTEYQGANYLLISRARRKASTPRLPRSF